MVVLHTFLGTCKSGSLCVITLKLQKILLMFPTPTHFYCSCLYMVVLHTFLGTCKSGSLCVITLKLQKILLMFPTPTHFYCSCLYMVVLDTFLGICKSGSPCVITLKLQRILLLCPTLDSFIAPVYVWLYYGVLHTHSGSFLLDMAEVEKLVRAIEHDGLLWGACEFTNLSKIVYNPITCLVIPISSFCE